MKKALHTNAKGLMTKSRAIIAHATQYCIEKQHDLSLIVLLVAFIFIMEVHHG